MSEIKPIFKIDAAMIPVFIILIITGVGIHLSAHAADRHSWVIWSAFHVVTASGFLLLAYFHIRQHIGWFKTLLNGNTAGRGVTLLLTLLMIIEILSGVILLAFVNGGGSYWGHFHWITGIILAIVGSGHILRRFKRLKKGLRNK